MMQLPPEDRDNDTVRFTRDADIGVLPFAPAAAEFCKRLKGEFHVNEQVMQQALACCGNFGIIHLKTACKIDFFVLGRSAFKEQTLLRNRMVPARFMTGSHDGSRFWPSKGWA